MAESDFIVRRANSLDDIKYVMKRATEEGWMVREKDAECYFSAGLTSDIFIGELNGKKISCLAVIKYGEQQHFIGFYVVEKPFQGKGYGLKTWNKAFADEDINERSDAQLYSVLNMQDRYKKFGFQPSWIARRYKLTIPRALEGLSKHESTSKIIPVSQANFEKLYSYCGGLVSSWPSSQVSKRLLACWLSHTQESSWAALGENGEVVGCLVMSKTVRFPEEGYRIGPFNANNASIAQSLLKVAVEHAEKDNPAFIFMDAVPELNVASADMMENLGAEKHFDCIFMGTKGPPDRCHEKVFGLASMEIM